MVKEERKYMYGTKYMKRMMCVCSKVCVSGMTNCRKGLSKQCNENVM